jgi:dihydrodipicolinate synthase/N-acetylneuraminate lyase
MGFEGNVSPELHAGVVNAFAARDFDKLQLYYDKLIKLSAMHMPYSGSSGRAIKPLLNRFGLPGGSLRAPRLPVAPEIVDRMVEETLKLDLPNFPKRTVQ